MVTKEMLIDPITRIEGHLALRVIVDTDKRVPLRDSVRSFVTMFRGFEVFDLGRPPEDLPHLNSRICGVCGASHANASVIAVDMAYGVSPKPMGVALRNMAFAMTDHIYDHTIILNMLEGPDYSAPVVALMTPKVYEEAKKTLAENRQYHGFTTIADIMAGLTPITGKIWQQAAKFQRIAREAGVLIYGRHSHPSTLIPGGIGTDLSNAEYLLVGYIYRLTKLTAWVKYMYAIWEDLLKFYEQLTYTVEGEEKSYAENGISYHPDPAKSTVLAAASGGIFDDPEIYGNLGDYVEWEEFYKKMDDNAKKRLLPAGVVYKGQLIHNSYAKYQASIVEYVDRAFYKDWAGKVKDLPWYAELEKTGFKDPLGNPLAGGKADMVPYHPWLKVTIPNPTKRDWNGKYTWVTHVRMIIHGEIVPFEVGPYARLLVASKQAFKHTGPGVEVSSDGNGTLKVALPRACTPELPSSVCEPMEFTWKVPGFSSTIYRLWARAFNILIDVAASWINAVKATQLVKAGRIETSRPWKQPARITFGVGFIEAPRGTVRHWVVQKAGKTLNIQIHAPTTGNVSPQDNRGGKMKWSPFEQSAINTFVTEERSPSDWTGLDFVRAIRSFDPCLACAAHIQFMKDGKIVKTVKKVITTAHYS